MKSLKGFLVAITLTGVLILCAGCTNSGTLATLPGQVDQTTSAAGSVNSPSVAAVSGIDWAKVSQFYHNYVAGMIAPVGLTIATLADPAAGPAIALASSEVANLDNLLAAKASNADIQAQAQILGKAVTDANAKVGAALAAAQAGTSATGAAASTTSTPATSTPGN